jgi:hypothetical protein
LLLVVCLLALYPTEYYWHHGRVEEWMIYRFIVCFLLGSAGFLLLCAAVLVNRMASLGLRRREGELFWIAAASHLFDGKVLSIVVVGTVIASGLLIWPGLVEFARTGGITLHWSRIIVAAFGFLLVFQALITKVLLGVISIWEYQHIHANPRPARAGTTGSVRAAAAAEPGGPR